jgi:DeoR family glycerol-3-phosphate regulon repressor
MQSVSPRQRDILSLAAVAGRVLVDDLARRFDMTPQTIRRDLNELCDRRIMSRIHGGAIIASGIENLGYEARRFVAADEKRLIGLGAAALIPNNSSLFINIGTTTEEVARAIQNHEGLLVITNNLNVANMLYRLPKIDVIVAGGPVRRGDGGVTGAAAVDFIRQFRVDHAIIGASAMDADGTILDFDYREVRVTQAIIENARNVILVADRSKFERVAPVRIGHLADIDTFVTDRRPNEGLAEVCRAHSVALVETGLDKPMPPLSET